MKVSLEEAVEVIWCRSFLMRWHYGSVVPESRVSPLPEIELSLQRRKGSSSPTFSAFFLTVCPLPIASLALVADPKREYMRNTVEFSGIPGILAYGKLAG
ncbi:hypothetical protein [Mesorhizobium sp.]|uniref:hypothetical protein n=1 Tax=Mesorhizobium sp. TaxID=1871066 RepID=UPI0025FD97EF|nr:hypothetical protein [Mesorhizobium sp.]